MARIIKERRQGTISFTRQRQGHSNLYLEASSPEFGATNGNQVHPGYAQVIALMKDKNPVPDSFMTVVGAQNEFYTPNPNFEAYDDAEFLLRNPNDSNDVSLGIYYLNPAGTYSQKSYEMKDGVPILYAGGKSRVGSRQSVVSQFDTYLKNAEKTVDFVAGNPKK